MKYSLTTLFLLLSIIVYAQQTPPWKSHKTANYQIQYPSEWTLELGKQNTEFFLMTALESNSDNFKENINLMIQDLKGMNMNLDSYTGLSEGQIKDNLANGKIIESTRVKNKIRSYHKIIYQGDTNGYTLKWLQHYWVIQDKAYVLTFTAEASSYDQYIATVLKIFESFKIAY
jgi:serine/threonine-protein kinase